MTYFIYKPYTRSEQRAHKARAVSWSVFWSLQELPLSFGGEKASDFYALAVSVRHLQVAE